jgi:DinB family protein
VSQGWVCPECGLDYDTISPNDTIVSLRSYPRRYREALGDLEDQARVEMLRRRPDPETWSALEYTAHVRDVFDWMADVFHRMLRENNPTIDFADPDEVAIDRRYNEQDPDAVLDALAANAGRAANNLAQAQPDDWTRPATFAWGERDLLTMARNAVHEGYHHLRDIEKVLQQVRGRTDERTTH